MRFAAAIGAVGAGATTSAAAVAEPSREDN